MNAQQPDKGVAKVIFGIMALASVLLGLMLYVLQDQIGIAEDTARLMSTAFIVVGIADTIVLLLWDRIFNRS
jgi:TRAP-type C4-dicarboxylate transport system permease small subunit